MVIINLKLEKNKVRQLLLDFSFALRAHLVWEDIMIVLGAKNAKSVCKIAVVKGIRQNRRNFIKYLHPNQKLPGG